MKVGFLGIGSMGAPMTRNLLKAGHEVMAWNRTREKAEALKQEGAQVADTPSEAARDAEAVITMLSDDRAVEEVVFGADGLLGALGQGAAHVSMSTISVALSKRLAAEHERAGQSYVAAPVFGRPEAASAAKLWVVAAGRQESIERCKPLFDAMGRGMSVVSEEPSGANVVKLCGNFLLSSMLEALGEAFALSRKSGVEARTLLEVVNGALFQSPIYANYGGLIADERFDPPGFRLRLGLKDVKLAQEAAEAAAVPMPLAGLLRDHFLIAIAHGGGDLDWSAIAKVSAEAAAVKHAEKG